MSISSIGHSVNQLRHKFSHSVGLPIREALPAAAIEAVVRSEGIRHRRCLFDPVVTIWAFLSQVLDTDRCCRKAVSRVWAYQSDAPPLPLEDADSVGRHRGLLQSASALIRRRDPSTLYPGGQHAGSQRGP